MSRIFAQVLSSTGRRESVHVRVGSAVDSAAALCRSTGGRTVMTSTLIHRMASCSCSWRDGTLVINDIESSFLFSTRRIPAST